MQSETPHTAGALDGADIVIGIPGYKNAGLNTHTVLQVHRGLQEYFPAYRGVIISADGGAKDGGRAVVLAPAAEGAEVLSVPYPMPKGTHTYDGAAGRGGALRTLFHVTQQLGAKVLVLLESDLQSIPAEWVQGLARPILEEGYDFVASRYTRHKFAGTITSGIVYPLTRALYGKSVRQPAGGEAGLSVALITRLLAQDVWKTEFSRLGTDIWISTQAICGGFKVCEAYLGAKKGDTGDPAVDLSEVLAQAVGSAFHELERNVGTWQRARGLENVPVLGSVTPVDAEPAKVDVEKMVQAFLIGQKNLQQIWGLFIAPASMVELKKMARQAPGAFFFDDGTWVRIIYDFAIAFHLRTLSRDHLLRALTPIYLGWVASFVTQVQDAGPREVEQRLERLCVVYERQKPYLISRWRWPDRFQS